MNQRRKGLTMTTRLVTKVNQRPRTAMQLSMTKKSEQLKNGEEEPTMTTRRKRKRERKKKEKKEKTRKKKKKMRKRKKRKEEEDKKKKKKKKKKRRRKQKMKKQTKKLEQMETMLRHLKTQKRLQATKIPYQSNMSVRSRRKKEVLHGLKLVDLDGETRDDVCAKLKRATREAV